MTREDFIQAVRKAVPNLSEESANVIMDEMKEADRRAGKTYSARDATLVQMAIRRRLGQQLFGVADVRGKRLGLQASGLHGSLRTQCRVTGNDAPDGDCTCFSCDLTRFKGYPKTR